MIKIILLKDAEAGRSVVFAKAVVEQNGFQLDVATGYIRKPKEHVAAKGTVAMDLPDTYVGKVTTNTQSFTVEGSDEVKQVTYIVVN